MALASKGHLENPAAISRLSIASWVLYDLANTIFSLNIISLYFSLWVVNVMGGTDQSYGNANGISMALMFFSAPVLGAISDQAPKRLPFLTISTIVCVLFTLLLGAGGLALSLFFFIIANYFYQAGLIFYDSLLAEVSTEENRGRIGGIGVGVGYLGSVIGIGTGFIILGKNPNAYDSVFKATAILFLIFALPAFFFIRERSRRVPPFNLDAVGRAFGQITQTVARARQYPGLGRFLVGRIFYADAANTVIAFMGIYVTNELGFTAAEAQLVLFVGILAAVLGGLCWGVVVDRLGPKRTLDIVLLLWTVTLVLAVVIPLLHLPSVAFWLVAALAGISLGGTWSADRPLMLRLSPPRYLGQFYGLYAMVGRFAAIIGPVLWGIIVDSLKWGRPAAIASLLVMIVLSFFILRSVSDERRNWGAADLLEPA
ncbi:MAG: MFS transporter [Chloroflexi bacterium]|nr:MFS transporter [Chloroflexota bacterium]